jgi:hypothetical protein
MRIAACETIQQWCFDETTIDEHEVINQWAMLVDVAVGDLIGEGGTTVVTLECAGILPCSLAENVVDHIEKFWERGKAAFILNNVIYLST